MVASDRSRDTLPIPLSLGEYKNGRFIPQTINTVQDGRKGPREHSCGDFRSTDNRWRVSGDASLSTASCRRGLGQSRNARKAVIQATCTKRLVSHKTTSHQRPEDGANDAVSQRSLEVELPQRHIFVVSPVHLRKTKTTEITRRGKAGHARSHALEQSEPPKKHRLSYAKIPGAGGGVFMTEACHSHWRP